MQARLAMPEELRRFVQPARVLIELGLVLLIAIIVARLAWLIVAPQASVSALEKRPLPSPIMSTARAVSADRSGLIRRNPFASGTVPEIPDAPETQLNLHLAGVFMSTDSFGGTAQITTPDNQTSRFTIDSEILPGVSLQRVLSDRVILQRNGESETLMLGGRTGSLSVIGDGSLASTPALPQPGPAATPSKIDGQIADPDVLLQVVQPSPVERNGRLYGYVLSSRGSADEMVAAGLAPGDVLLEINGTSVSELDVNELANEIGNNNVAILRIERDGNLQTVRLKFDE
ncbi:MAG: hypothetical protein L3J02_08240 [Henriciella sp.]|nr:hypothetical protein [Henriciella sp.]